MSYSDIDNNGSIDPGSEIIQEKNYYPFGLEHKGYNNVVNGTENNHFTYNVKELEEDLGLDWTDFGARRYMRDLGRWTTVDPLTANAPGWSPYNAMWNNPILNVDSNGRWAAPPGDYYKEDGTYLGSDGIDDNKVYTADGTSTSEDGTTTFNNAQELSVTHTQFQTMSAIVKHEGVTTDLNEYLWIAHTANNAAKESGTSLHNKLMSGYSSVPRSEKTPLATSNNSATAISARAGILNVLSGGVTQQEVRLFGMEQIF